MRFNSDSQLGLSKRIGLRRRDLFVLTTYSDRDAATVAERFYWSDSDRLYDYNAEGTVREFRGVVRTRTGPDTGKMSHIQDFGGGHAITCELVLVNRPQPDEAGAEYLVEQLRARAFRSTIEVVEVLIRQDQDEFDLSNLPGDQHTVVFRGETQGVVKCDQDTFTLQFTAIEPKVPYLYALGDFVATDDLGKRLPIIYGRMKYVEAVGLNVGGESTLREALTDNSASVTLKLTDASKFHPGNNGNKAVIDGELFTIVPSAGSNNVAASGRSPYPGTSDYKQHALGATVVEVVDSVFCVAGHIVKAINEVFAKRPDGRIYEIPSTLLTKNTSHEGAGPGGETIATVTISRTNFLTLIDELEKTTATEVTQQPSVSQQSTLELVGINSFGDTDLGADFTEPGWVDIVVGDRTQDTALGGATPCPASDRWTIDPLLTSIFTAGFDPNNITLNNYATGHTDITPGADGDFYIGIGVGAGPGGRITTAERNAGGGARCVVAGPFEFADGVPVQYSEELDVSSLTTEDLTTVHILAGTAGTYLSNVWSIIAEGITTSEVTTDIEVAGDEASKVEVGGQPNRYGTNQLKIYAHVDGYTDTGVESGTLLEDFPEIAEHFIETVCGVTNGGDQSEDAALAVAALADLPHAMDVRSLGTGFAQILARMAWEARTNIVRTEGQVTPGSGQPLSDLFAIDFDGASETTFTGDGNHPSRMLGFANAWSAAAVLALRTMTTGQIQISDFNDTPNGIFLSITAGGQMQVNINDESAGAKTYLYDVPELDINTIAELSMVTVTWDGTDLRTFMSTAAGSSELTPTSTPDDDAITMSEIGRFMSVGGIDGFWFSFASWEVAITDLDELAEIAGLVLGGGVLTADVGDYVSSADLRHQFRPGFAGDPTYGQSVILDDTVEGLLTSANTVGVSDIFDTDGLGFVLLQAGITTVTAAAATVSALLEWGDDPGLADAAPINPAFLIGPSLPADFDAVITLDNVDSGGYVVIHYNPTVASAKRYLRWTFTETGLAGGEQVGVLADTFEFPLGQPGDTFIRDEVAVEAGGVSIAYGGGAAPTITAADLVEAPGVFVPAVPGNTYYRICPPSTVATKFAYGFPYLSATSELARDVVLDQYTAVSEEGRDPDTIKSRFRALFGWNATRGQPGDANAFGNVLLVSPTDVSNVHPRPALLAAAELRWGRRDEESFAFLTIQNAAVAADTLAYLAHTAILDTRLWTFQGTPWVLSYGLELGDTVVVPEVPWAPDEPWLCRVLGIARNNDTGLGTLILLGVARVGALVGDGLIVVTGAGVAGVVYAMAGAGLVAITGAGVVFVTVTTVGAGAVLPFISGAGQAIAHVRMVGNGDILGFITGSGNAEWTV